jgi:hypothetical protein
MALEWDATRHRDIEALNDCFHPLIVKTPYQHQTKPNGIVACDGIVASKHVHGVQIGSNELFGWATFVGEDEQQSVG